MDHTLVAVRHLMLSGEMTGCHRPDLGPIRTIEDVAPVQRSRDIAWLMVHLRKRNWRELRTNVLRTRPEHVDVLAGFAQKKLETLWKRH